MAAGFLGGLTLGTFYFHALRGMVDLLVRGGPPLALVLTLGRLALLCAGPFLAVRMGGTAILSALAGIRCAKAAMLRRMPG